ncbi:MAG: hypothetical protein LBC61_02450 [Candidatus Peribacteria bacterium]|nr:hypothetical protein [Candidatus Peribacteria bacterium]
MFFIFQIISENIVQTIVQNKAHQAKAIVNIQIPSPKVLGVTTQPPKIIHNTTTNKANEVPSLNKLSHSKIKANLLGAQSSLNIDNTATGSVLQIKAQKSKQTKNGILNPTRGKAKYNKVQITKAEIISQAIAKREITL